MAGAMNRGANKPGIRCHVFVRHNDPRSHSPLLTTHCSRSTCARARNCTYTFARNMFLQEHCGKLLCLPTNALIFKDFQTQLSFMNTTTSTAPPLHRICMMDGPWPAQPPSPLLEAKLLC